jgi:hypothetical protein
LSAKRLWQSSNPSYRWRGTPSIVLLGSTSDKQQSVLANPSTNRSPDHIHMNKCTHERCPLPSGSPANDAYYDIMVIHNTIEGLDSLGPSSAVYRRERERETERAARSTATSCASLL